ncbi:MAG: alpha/beta fold hydrolase [Idiomarina sp.]
MTYQLKHSAIVGGSIAISLYGNPKLPKLLLLGGISGTRHAITPTGDGWWQGLEQAIPLADYCIVGVDYVGGIGESELQQNNPVADLNQHAKLIAEALIAADINTVATVIGGSFGGTVALALAQQGTITIGQLVIVAAAHRPHASAVILRNFQRDLLQLAQTAGNPELGAELARALAMFSYRSSDALDHYHPQPKQAYDYLRSRAAQLVANNPRRTAQLFEQFGPALDNFRLDPQGIVQPTLVIGFTSDQLAPPQLMTEFAEQLSNCAGMHLFESSYGHDGFIKDTANYASLVRDFLILGNNT